MEGPLEFTKYDFEVVAWKVSPECSGEWCPFEGV
jgi:hypothetical protein